MQKTVWTRIRLPSRRLIWATEASSGKKGRLATAVWISGTLRGGWMMMNEAVWRGQRRVRVVASAAGVATRVGTMGAGIGTVSVVREPPGKPSFWRAGTYQ